MTTASGAIARGAIDATRPWWRRHLGLLLVEAAWFAFAANFAYGFVYGGDAQVPYAFVRRLFGANIHATGYEFGQALFEAPFYGLGKGLEAAGLTTINTHPSNQVMIALGAVVYAGVAVLLVYVVLVRLGVRYPALAAGITLFGSNLFYYGTFSPGQTHVVDVLIASALTLTALLGFQKGWPPWVACLAGALVGLAMTSRVLDAALGGGLVLTLALYRHRRSAAIVVLSAGVAYGALALIPMALGASLFEHRTPSSILAWSPMSPVDMLFTLKRGLFLWTPVAALSLVGYASLLRRRPQRRPFLISIGLMALALVAVQAFVPFWDAGWSFSQRYLAGLFPFIAVGVGGLLDLRPRLTVALCTAAVTWSVFLALSMVTLPYNDEAGGVDELVHLAGQQSAGSFAWGVWHRSHLRKVTGD